jgi:hypothetical protein
VHNQSKTKPSEYRSSTPGARVEEAPEHLNAHPHTRETEETKVFCAGENQPSFSEYIATIYTTDYKQNQQRVAKKGHDAAIFSPAYSSRHPTTRDSAIATTTPMSSTEKTGMPLHEHMHTACTLTRLTT